MIRLEQTKRLRWCSECGNGIDIGETVLVYSIGQYKNILCEDCLTKLSEKVAHTNAGWLEEIHT